MQEREIPFWETVTNRKDASTRKKHVLPGPEYI